MRSDQTVKIVDLFAGIGGLRQGVVKGLRNLGYDSEIVFTSEIKPAAVATLSLNWPEDVVSGDITQVNESDIPSHSLLLAGFPCQAFSYAGARRGFGDTTRGTLFFDVLRILKHHLPDKFILENVEGLVTHDREPGAAPNSMGRTMTTILRELEELGYKVFWEVLNATDFGVPQSRRRVFITGSLTPANALQALEKVPALPLSSIVEKTPQIENNEDLERFTNLLKAKYGDDLSPLEGKIFRDWRGGARNIHSWDIGLKGAVPESWAKFLDLLAVESKRTHWANAGLTRIGEGFPLTAQQIMSFLPEDTNEIETVEMLDTLLEMRYLKADKPNTYRISSGRLTFPISHILRLSGYSPTVVATDCDRLTIIPDGVVRRFTQTEMKRLFGFGDDFAFPSDLSYKKKCDLFGNSVVIPVAEKVTENLYKA